MQLSYISKDQAIIFLSPSPQGVILLSILPVLDISESSFSDFILNNRRLLLFTLAVDQNPLGVSFCFLKVNTQAPPPENLMDLVWGVAGHWAVPCPHDSFVQPKLSTTGFHARS